MIDVCLLGTGGMMPLPYRHLTSLLLRYNGASILVDAGEGTQVAIKKCGYSFKSIDVICFTHFHGDHISGLPGLLLSMGNAERSNPLLIVGPKRVEKIVNALRVIAPELPFEIIFRELEQEVEEFQICGLTLRGFRAQHNITCYGYSFMLSRAGKFDVERAKMNQVPLPCWSILQKQDRVEYEGNIYTQDMVLGPERKGLKLTYCTDSRPIKRIALEAAESDLFICEGMYGEEGKEEKAVEHKHMTMYEAAALAKEANVKELWLTHYSPSMAHPEQYKEQVRKVFSETKICRDGRSMELKFIDEK